MWNWFKKKHDNEVKYLIIGLGNIGPEYKGTRHNIGFDVVERWAERNGMEFDSGRLGFVSHGRFRGKGVILLKPTTYMNLSGKAVKHWMSKEKIDRERILVITDDLALPLAKLRLKTKGGHAGHNGLKDIIAQLGSDEFPRLRFGIGSDFGRGRQVEFVLGKWSEEERAALELSMDKAMEMIDAFLINGAERAMNAHN